MATILGSVFLFFGLAIVIAVATRSRTFAWPLVVAFLARGALALIDDSVYRLPGQDDGGRFDYFGYQWSRAGFLGTLDHITTGANLYTWLVSAFYSVFERSRLMMQAINVLFGTLIVLNIGRLTEVLGGDRKHCLRAAWLTALFPSTVFFSAAMLREVAVAYPLSLGVLYLARGSKERKASHFVVAAVALLVSMAFHSGTFAVLLVLGIWLVGLWLRSVSIGGFTHFGRNTVALVVGALAIAFVASSGFGMEKFQRVSSGDVGDLETTQRYFASGRAAYLQGFHPESTMDLTWQAPIRLVYFLFAPFPWMLESPADIVGVVDALFFLTLLVVVFRGRRALIENREVLLVTSVFGAMALTFALGVSNYGTAHRHRNKMLPLLIAVGCAVPIPLGRRARARTSVLAGGASPRGPTRPGAARPSASPRVA